MLTNELELLDFQTRDMLRTFADMEHVDMSLEVLREQLLAGEIPDNELARSLYGMCVAFAVVAIQRYRLGGV